ncbi:nucleoside-diphosphate sugar epimerase [Longimonas halophila]|uniref:UDP-glucuronate decarboxylase n=1 Tax=Longimonas halophila TaxID=1469170 RepID=A0A2H3NNQ6_9BACT|nr:GDP-mannose 4,6-dehydratase [Longimonas halophila]PEN08385.1 nucleoside-diphosphate sugar epimerase [Longimonas halophila]
MRYLITGGAGFIGSHLADHLLAQGHHVHAFDNLSTGSLDTIAHLANHERFALTIGDVCNKSALETAASGCDRIVHLAAAVGVKHILEHPVETITTNVRGTEHVLEIAEAQDSLTLIASTSEVYGKALETVDNLDTLAEDGPWVLGATSKRRWAYACTKAMDEFLALAYASEYGTPVIAARFFNTVGPRQTGQYGMVVPSFVKQALAGEPITVYGDGRQTRCFTHVQDAVEVVDSLMNTESAHGEVFNIGRPDPISINTLAERVRELSGADVPINHIPYDEAYGDGFEDMRRRTPDMSKLQAAIGTRPERDLDTILRDVIDHERAKQQDMHSENGVASLTADAFNGA